MKFKSERRVVLVVRKIFRVCVLKNIADGGFTRWLTSSGTIDQGVDAIPGRVVGINVKGCTAVKQKAVLVSSVRVEVRLNNRSAVLKLLLWAMLMLQGSRLPVEIQNWQLPALV